MNSVMIRLLLTLTSPNAHPILIDKLVAIHLGRTLEGKPNAQSALYPGTTHAGEVAVDLVLPPNAAFEFPSLPLTGLISRISPSGTLATSRIDVQPRSISQTYRQLEIVAAKYKSGM